MPRYPQRIVCLTEETVETLYELGAGDLVVGVSGFCVRPPEARKKPKISTFIDAKYDAIDALKPDLVLAFSDLQADIAREVARRGHAVHVFNQRSIDQILEAMRVTGALVGKARAGERLADRYARGLDALEKRAKKFPRRPRVFFEEWPDPLISGIAWCSEIVERMGGVDVCAESRARHDAKGRVYSPGEIARRRPEVVIASWCGKKVKPAVITSRPGWRDVRVFEVKSSIILQPGPAALGDGARKIFEILASVVEDGREH